MADPLVCAVCLTADRPEMTRRAVECFRQQTYANKRMLVWDTSQRPGEPLESDHFVVWHVLSVPGLTIGELRNRANHTAVDLGAEVLIHWDSDDLSRPERISEQVAHLEQSGADAVGYNQVLFWRDEPRYTPPFGVEFGRSDLHELPAGEAWLYTNRNPHYVIGASLCYWAEAWKKRPFEALPKAKGGTGEDTQWLREVRCEAMPGINISTRGTKTVRAIPRLICTIHGSNSQDYSVINSNSPNWQRTPEWDDYCPGVFPEKAAAR